VFRCSAALPRLARLTWQLAESLALPSAHRAAVSSLEWHPLRDNILATGGAEGVVRLWDARTGAEFLRYSGHPGAVGALKFTPHGRLIASGSSDGKLIVRTSLASTVNVELATT
jgi:WD40 repeat protein